jgi:hypothetical protein
MNGSNLEDMCDAFDVIGVVDESLVIGTFCRPQHRGNPCSNS